MFIGHYAVAMAAKRAAPSVSLAMLFVAAQWMDLLWPVLLLFGVEQVHIDPGNTAMTPLDFVNYPYTHSLVASVVWSVVLGGAYFLWRRDGRASLWVGMCVLSHWILDFVTHRPDLPLAPGSPSFFGLGLWNHVPATVIVELAMFVGGIAVYLRTTRASGRTGQYAFWGLVVFFLFIWVGNILGPPPPDERAIAFVGNAMWLFVLWAWWIERNRTVDA